MFVEKTEPIGFNEIAIVRQPDGTEKKGQVLDTSDDIVVIQVFEGTSGIEKGSGARFLGETMKMPVSQDMLGRILSGSGEPLDGGPTDHTRAEARHHRRGHQPLGPRLPHRSSSRPAYPPSTA